MWGGEEKQGEKLLNLGLPINNVRMMFEFGMADEGLRHKVVGMMTL